MPQRLLTNPDELTLGDLAKYLNISVNTIKGWLRYGTIPEPQRRGRLRAWTRAEADEIKQRMRR